jgi:hypothetical protein
MAFRANLRPGTRLRAALALSVFALIGLLIVCVFRLRMSATERAHSSPRSEPQPSEIGSTVEEPVAASSATIAGRNPSPNEDNRPGSAAAAAIGAGSIDWTLVGDSSPIPRAMPANESDDPYRAGFARQWVEQSLKNRTAFFGREAGSPLLDPKPFLLEVVSEPKNPDDSWPYGVEYELRRIVEQQSHESPAPEVTRIFCNSHGCLVYLEFEGDKMANISAIPSAILKSSWRKDFGIEKSNVFVLLGRQEEPKIKWQLFLVHRHLPR